MWTNVDIQNTISACVKQIAQDENSPEGGGGGGS